MFFEQNWTGKEMAVSPLVARR